MQLTICVGVMVLGCAAAMSLSTEPCICTEDYTPVCGVDKITYGNKCNMDCAGVELAYTGRCQCMCPRILDRKCGTDGNTYDNMCLLDCAGTSLNHDGACQRVVRAVAVCPCPFNYLPVCGSDGITYSNKCGLECQQKEDDSLTKVSDGACPTQSPILE